jgi:outer membrane protein assembly factor BamD (BamD/ComL family)
MYISINRPLTTLGLFLLLTIQWQHSAPGLWAAAHTPPHRLNVSSRFSEDQLLMFADQLMREGEYFRAITEYRRFLFTYPTSTQRSFAHFRIGFALYQGQHYDRAFTIFREVVERYPGTHYAKQAMLWQGESLMRQSQYPAAEHAYEEMDKTLPDDESRQQARYQRGWALLYQRQWQKASVQFQRVTPESHLYPAAQILVTEALNGSNLPQKSPWTAGILSGLLPGSGQLYNGRAGDALLAFFLNALFTAGIVEAVNQDRLAIAGILSFFETGWYVGNIYGAVNGAHKHNRHSTETFIRNLENRFRLSPSETRGTVGIRFSFGF